MSMAKCKCDKIIDTDFEMGFDEKGECCCDNCEQEMYNQLIKDLEKARSKESESLAEYLINEGYRKIK